MATKKEEVTKIGSLDQVISIVDFISREEWEFTLEGNSTQSLSIGLFDGTLILRSNGTWYYA